ncbi:MAG TPA: VOC family protein [Gammaproteobacteria bacterium]
MRSFFILVAGLVMGAAIQSAIAQSGNRGISHMNHVGIVVPDIHAAVEYYTETLGFTEAFRAVNDQGEPRLVYIQVSERSFIELNNGNGRDPGIGHLGIQVEDMQAATAMFRNAGADVSEIRDSSTGAILANITDLNGIRIELAQLPPESDHYKAMMRWAETH